LPGAFKIWIAITAKGPRAMKDVAIGLLVSAGSGAVIESNKSAGSFPDAEEGPALTASLPEGADSKLAALGEALMSIGWTMTLSTIRDRDWSVAWRSGMRPVRFSYRGSGLLVRTSWSRAKKKEGVAEVIIDPSMAFGTGAHPTTKMCLKALLMLFGGPGEPLAKGPLLDIGTGSAILIIAALKLGAKGAVGLEIDSLAIRVARKNLRLNNVKARLSQKPLSTITQKFSIITANLFSEELRRLGPGLAERLGHSIDREGGYMVLSGILREQAPAVISVYKGLGMRVFKKFVEGEWACLLLCRSAANREAR